MTSLKNWCATLLVIEILIDESRNTTTKAFMLSIVLLSCIRDTSLKKIIDRPLDKILKTFINNKKRFYNLQHYIKVRQTWRIHVIPLLVTSSQLSFVDWSDFELDNLWIAKKLDDNWKGSISITFDEFTGFTIVESGSCKTWLNKGIPLSDEMMNIEFIYYNNIQVIVITK